MLKRKFKLGLYRHYKGKLYQVNGLAMHSETMEDLVLYEALYENNVASHWARPLKMFMEDVIVDGKVRPRFDYIGNKKGDLSKI